MAGLGTTTPRSPRRVAPQAPNVGALLALLLLVPAVEGCAGKKGTRAPGGEFGNGPRAAPETNAGPGQSNGLRLTLDRRWAVDGRSVSSRNTPFTSIGIQPV